MVEPDRLTELANRRGAADLVPRRSQALAAWSRGEVVDRPLTLDGEPAQLEQLLGERTQEKAWLAASLARTVRAFVMTPRGMARYLHVFSR